jgi:hypothetical protein
MSDAFDSDKPDPPKPTVVVSASLERKRRLNGGVASTAIAAPQGPPEKPQEALPLGYGLYPHPLPDRGPRATQWVLDTLFHPQRVKDAWVAIVGDVNDRAAWAGGRYGDLSETLHAATQSAHFVNSTIIRPGGRRRWDGLAESAVFLFFDDVGEVGVNPTAKMDQGWLDLCGPTPTFVVETSAGNSQYFYAFTEPVKPDAYRRLIKMLKANLDTNPGFSEGAELTRYARLPSGVNVKPGRGMFGTRLLAASGKTYTIKELIAGFRLKADMPKPKATAAGATEKPADGQEAKPERSDLAELERLLMGPDAPLRNDKIETYADYINVLIFLHGATDGSDEGLALAIRWAADHPHKPGYDPESKWSTINAPFGGANSLWKLARQMDPIGTAKLAFDPIPDPPEPDLDLDPASGQTKFKLVPYAEIDFDLTHEDLIREVLPAQGLALLFGAPKAFKSFVAMDMGLYVAAAWDWAGRKTQHGPVVYIAAENARGTRKRIEGFRLKHRDRLPDELPFFLIETAPNLGTEKHDFKALREAIHAVTPTPILIVVDTLAQTLFGGDENGTGMAIFVGVCTALAQRFGCCVLAVHHPPLGDDKRPRGHSSLRGGLDANLLVERNEHAMTTTVTVEKLKDDEDGNRIIVHMERIVIGYTPDLHAVSTLVVARTEDGGRASAATQRGEQTKRPPPQRRMLMQVVTDALNETGETIADSEGGSPVFAVHDAEIRSRYYARLAEKPDEDTDDDEDKAKERKARAFRRAMSGALDAENLFAREIDGKRFVWLPL